MVKMEKDSRKLKVESEKKKNDAGNMDFK